jgi:hypothetical protein
MVFLPRLNRVSIHNNPGILVKDKEGKVCKTEEGPLRLIFILEVLLRDRVQRYLQAPVPVKVTNLEWDMVIPVAVVASIHPVRIKIL